MKVEVKQEAASEVKVEVKEEPSCLSHGQPLATRALKRARTEATLPSPPPSPPPPEPWRATFAIPPMYQNPSDGEWAGYNMDVWLSAAATGIVIIDNDEDDMPVLT
jgi:hypothetical protein